MEERLFHFIQDVVQRVTGKKGLLYDTDFVKDLGLTSFDVMNIVCAFEDHFDVEIPSRDVWKLHKVKDVIDYMIRKGCKFMIEIVKRGKLIWFALYCAIVGVVAIITYFI